MSKIISFIVLLVSIFIANAAAQTAEETFPVQNSKLSAINLPTGALQVRESSVPAEIKQTLSRLIAAGGDKIRQGSSEVVVWSGNYKKSSGSQMIKNLENSLKNSGWEYEIGEKSDEFVLFSLFRAEPSRRALVGFFVPSEEAFIFAITEMIPSNAPTVETANRSEESNDKSRNTSKNVSGDFNLIGKWTRSEGSGFIDYTGKTQYKSGASYSFEFFPDGTVSYVYEKDVLSIIQCRIKGEDKARGRYTVNGDSLTINLNAGTSVSSNSCDAKENYNKALPATTISKKFTVKKMESITRPDNPVILCFEGQDGDGCFERVK